MATAKTRSASRLLGLSLRPRTSHAVHIKIHPRPRNLAESRQILQVLQEYGRVVMYKHLKYEPEAPAHNSAIAIYQNPSSAKALIDASPLTFELEVGKIGSASATTHPDLNATITDVADDESLEQGEEHRTKFDSHTSETVTEAVSSPRKSSIDKLAAAFAPVAEPIPECNLPSQTSPRDQAPHIPAPNSPPPTDHSIPPRSSTPETSPLESGTEFREFRLQISYSQGNHQEYIKRQAYYGGFKVDTSSIMAEDLEGRVPLEGMVDCAINRPEVPLWVRDMRRDKNEKVGMGSLRKLWEEGRRIRGEV
ncbi:hypothetical protein MMC31_006214 [Peltigera leucophlebia]|nr:hypothetical protein [Peltigera leucophlebia]